MALPILKPVRNLRRLRQIIGVFARYGFSQILDEAQIIRSYLPKRYREKYPKRSAPERLKLALEELGPTFIKLGQMLSVRVDLLPPEYIQALSQLQDKTTPLPYRTIKEVVEQELEGTLHSLFPSFRRSPIASASLSQVHIATTKDGRRVAVKVQRPGIREIIAQDLEIIETVAIWLENETSLGKTIGASDIAREFRDNITLELDFIHEGQNCQLLKSILETEEDVIVPTVISELSTSKVLTMEYIEGVKLLRENIEKQGLNPEDIATKGTHIILKQIFEYGIFHADPHPGNILLTEDGKLAFLDFGLIGKLDGDTRDILIQLGFALSREDVEAITDMLIDMDTLPISTSRAEFKRDLARIISYYSHKPVKHISISEITRDTTHMITKYHIRVPRNLVLLAKALATIEGVAKDIHPDLSFTENLTPFFTKMVKQYYSPSALVRRMGSTLNHYTRFIMHLPRNLSLILRKIETGELKVEFKHVGLENLIDTLNAVASRLSYSIIIASLIIGASLIITTSPQGGIPLLSYIGIGIAIILSLILIIREVTKK